MTTLFLSWFKKTDFLDQFVFLSNLLGLLYYVEMTASSVIRSVLLDKRNKWWMMPVNLCHHFSWVPLFFISNIHFEIRPQEPKGWCRYWKRRGRTESIYLATKRLRDWESTNNSQESCTLSWQVNLIEIRNARLFMDSSHVQVSVCVWVYFPSLKCKQIEEGNGN